MNIYTNDGYYEAIFQLRPEDQEVIKFIKKQLEKKNIKISKEVKSKHGIDYYLTSRKFAVSLARKLKKSFKGDIKVSKSLYSVDRMTSKRLYRLTVCFRLRKEE